MHTLLKHASTDKNGKGDITLTTKCSAPKYVWIQSIASRQIQSNDVNLTA